MKKMVNMKWADATCLEMTQLMDYNLFKDASIYKKVTPPDKYKKITGFLVFDVKHNVHFKACYITGGHLTEIPVNSIYFGVILLRGLNIVSFLSELNDLSLWATDMKNTYLEAYTVEKCYIIAGKKFGKNLEGHMMIINKALYSLRSKRLRWHERFADCLCDIGFTPSCAEPDIWMKRVDDHYEYIAVYVDNLAIMLKNPKNLINVLNKCYKFKLK